MNERPIQMTHVSVIVVDNGDGPLVFADRADAEREFKRIVLKWVKDLDDEDFYSDYPDLFEGNRDKRWDDEYGDHTVCLWHTDLIPKGDPG